MKLKFRKIVMFIIVIFLILIIPYQEYKPIRSLDLTQIGSDGNNKFSRKITTSINIYSKVGTIPQVRYTKGKYKDIDYNILYVKPSFDTFLQVDYAGSTPKYMDEFVDKELLKQGYWIVGGINAGFFVMGESSNLYGYPTGAVLRKGILETYEFNNEIWETAPSYGSGFTTAYFDNCKLELKYNGWKDGVWYGDEITFKWGVSGAYTLLKDNKKIHLGKDDYGPIDYWNNTNSVSLFGQRRDKTYILLITHDSISSNDQYNLMKELGAIDAIRFDGGGSNQMMVDKGLVNKPYTPSNYCEKPSFIPVPMFYENYCKVINYDEGVCKVE